LTTTHIYEYDIQRFLLGRLFEYKDIRNNFSLIGFSTNFLHTSNLRPDIIVLGRNPNSAVFVYLRNYLHRIASTENKVITLEILLDLFSSAPFLVIEIEPSIRKSSLSQILIYETYFPGLVLVFTVQETMTQHLGFALERLNLDVLKFDFHEQQNNATIERDYNHSNFLIGRIEILKLSKEDPYNQYIKALKTRYLLDLILILDVCKLIELDCLIPLINIFKNELPHSIEEQKLFEHIYEYVSMIPQINVVTLLQYLDLLRPLYEKPERHSIQRVYINHFKNKNLNMCNAVNMLYRFNMLLNMFNEQWFLGQCSNLISFFYEFIEPSSNYIDRLWSELKYEYIELLYDRENVVNQLKRCLAKLEMLKDKCNEV